MSATTKPEEALPDEEVQNHSPWWQRFVTGSSTWIGLILVGLILVFSTLEYESFVSSSNARNVTTDAAVLLVLAVGMTFVIVTAGIDLSVGAVLVFSGVISARLMNEVGGNDWGTLLIGLAGALGAGLAWGTLNGFLIAKARIPALIVTLGTLGMALGGALLITGGVDEREVPFKLIDTFGVGRVFDQIPYLVIIAFTVAIVFGVVLAGTLSGLAGFLNLARFGTTTIGGHNTDNLQAIAAVVIGGTSLFGGIGTVLGSVFGVFIPAVLQNGFVITGVQPFWQQVAVGAVLIGAVYLDQLRRRSQHQR
jgi:ribose transport system permease protein